MPLKGITAQLIFNLCYAITLLQQQPAPQIKGAILQWVMKSCTTVLQQPFFSQFPCIYSLLLLISSIYRNTHLYLALYIVR